MKMNFGKCHLFISRNKTYINKMKRVLVLKGIFSETTYVCVLTYQFQASSIILTSFKQEGGGGVLPPSTSKRTPKKPTQIRVNL